MKIKVPVFYIYIYALFKQKSERGVSISYAQIKEIFKRRVNKIPTSICLEILKEMEELNLLRRHGNTYNINYELLGKDIDKKIRQILPPLS